jgi:phenylpropionate dioxygenase-like ring-hydroxylating dioxygenase large terminal subunit
VNSSTNPGRIARCPGPSTRDIILGDGDNPPAHLTQESYEFLGDEDIPYTRYYDPDFFRQEQEKLWPNVWQWACREEHIPSVGDYHVYDVGRHSVLVVRTAPDVIKAYRNACLHRGVQLKASHSCGHMERIRCPFHGFTWKLNGALDEIPCQWDFPHIDPAKFSLPEAAVAVWGGFVFINMNRNAPPLTEYLEVLPQHFETWPLEDRYVELHVEKTLPCNWKLAAEAFIEAFHILETHPGGLYRAGDANTQYDVFGKHVSRFVQTRAVQSPHYKGVLSQERVLEAMGGPALGVSLEKGQSARSAYAEHVRRTMSAKLDRDLSKVSATELIDSIEYFLFPNMFFFPGIELPMAYRFRPNGEDQNTSVFDLMFLRPKPPSGAAPAPAEPYKIGIEDSYTIVPGISQRLAGVYDQDTGNMALQQRGVRNSAKRGQTLGNYQEIRIRRLHRTLDLYLNA